jgi:hypothetical protein
VFGNSSYIGHVFKPDSDSKMNRNQAAGHLGAANNQTISAEARHSSRQQLMIDAQKASGVSQPNIAG